MSDLYTGTCEICGYRSNGVLMATAFDALLEHVRSTHPESTAQPVMENAIVDATEKQPS